MGKQGLDNAVGRNNAILERGQQLTCSVSGSHTATQTGITIVIAVAMAIRLYQDEIVRNILASRAMACGYIKTPCIV